MEITLTRPDDWHLHLRDGDAIADVLPHTAERFSRAIVMPNLKPPVTDVAGAMSYRDRILQALPNGMQFEPLMTLYLTQTTTTDIVDQAAENDAIKAFKLYPAGATTNSADGVADVKQVYPILEQMQKRGLTLCIHGEVINDDADIFDREALFIEHTLQPLLAEFPELNVVLEHITTKEAASLVAEGPNNLAATITPQHLMYNRNAILVGGIKPHYYCLPIIKRETHRQALVDLATSGHNRVFLGTDSAPHAKHAKENACGCAGMYSSHAAIELYADIFDAAGKLDKLEAFASFNGPDFYRLPRNTDVITLRKESWEIPGEYPFTSHTIVPLKAGETVGWKLVS